MKHVFNHAFKIYLSTLNCILVEYVIDQMHQELRMAQECVDMTARLLKRCRKRISWTSKFYVILQPTVANR